MFKDRHDAGKQLAHTLEAYKKTDSIVCALPRGGVVIGYEIAHYLKLPLEIVITRKIGHPQSPEYAIGAVTETGRFIGDEQELLSVDKEWLKNEIEKERQEAVRRKKLYATDHRKISVKDKTAIIVDDGVATGLTLSLAINEVRAEGPREIVVAVPVISNIVANTISEISDKLVAIETTGDFAGSVGDYYENFEQLSDNEVIILLSKLWQKR